MFGEHHAGDRKRFIVLVLGLLSSFLISLPQFAFSNLQSGESWDWKTSFGARSLPSGAALAAELGYNQLLWGERPGFQYGYFRPAMRLATSGWITSSDLRLSLYPISLVGLHVGVVGSKRNSPHWDTIDCDQVQCGGWLFHRYAEADAVAAYGPVVGSAHAGWRRMDPSGDEVQPFAEETSALIGTRGGDTLWGYGGFLGWRLDRRWTVGMAWRESRMLDFGSQNTRRLGLVNFSQNDVRISLAFGTYESPTQTRAFSAGLQVDWLGSRGLALSP